MAVPERNNPVERAARAPTHRRISANKAMLALFVALFVALLALLVVAVMNYSGAQRRSSPTTTPPAQTEPGDAGQAPG